MFILACVYCQTVLFGLSETPVVIQSSVLFFDKYLGVAVLVDYSEVSANIQDVVLKLCHTLLT